MKKIVISLVFIMFLSSCFNQENNNKIVTVPDKQENTKNINLDKVTLGEFQNSLHSKTGKLDLSKKINNLENSDIFEDKQKTVFLKSFVGDYNEALKLQKDVCDENINDKNCNEQVVDFSILSILDSNSNKITDLKDISIKLNSEETTFNNSFTGKLVYNFNHRLSIDKKGYISHYEKIVAKNYYLKKLYEIEAVLEKYSLYKKADPTIENTYKTDNYEFIIGDNSFTKKDGTEITGDIDIYLFDIEPKEVSLFRLDIFSKETFTNLGNHLVNKSTALIKAYSGKEELKIVKPIKVLSNLNNISIKTHLTDLDKIPKNIILTEDLNKEYRMPFIGNLNSDSGVWISTELKVLNSDGDIEFLLY